MQGSWGQQLREAVDLASLVGQRVQLRQQGRQLVGCCPLHPDRSPSLSVDPERGLWHCFGCRAGGDAISWQMALEGQDFREAALALAAQFGVPLEGADTRPPWWDQAPQILQSWVQRRQEMLAADRAVQRWLQQRGWTRQMVQDWALGYSPPGWAPRLGPTERQVLQELGWVRPDGRDQQAGRCSFPLWDLRGRLVGLWGRAVTPAGRPLPTRMPKYLGTPNAPRSQLLLGSWLVPRDQRQLVLVEGPFDAAALAAAGQRGALALLGTSLSTPQVRWLANRASQVLLALDGDGPGQAAARAAAQALEGRVAQVLWVPLPKGVDPAELWARGDREALQGALEAAEPAVQHWVDLGLRRWRRAPDPGAATRAHQALQRLVGDIQDPVARASWTRYLALQMGPGVAPMPTSRDRRSPPGAGGLGGQPSLDLAALWCLRSLGGRWPGFWLGLLQDPEARQEARSLLGGGDPGPWMSAGAAPRTTAPDQLLWGLVYRRARAVWEQVWSGEEVDQQVLQRLARLIRQGAGDPAGSARTLYRLLQQLQLLDRQEEGQPCPPDRGGGGARGDALDPAAPAPPTPGSGEPTPGAPSGGDLWDLNHPLSWTPGPPA